MASAVVSSGSCGDVPLPPASAAQEKASRNKRKYRADPPAAGAGPFAVPYPPPDCPGYELFSAEKAAAAAAEGSDSGSANSFNLEHLASVCDMCKTIMCGSAHGAVGDEGLEWEGFHDVDWSDLTESQLEEILLGNLDMMFSNAVKTIASQGHSEEVARNALVSVGERNGWRDNLSVIAEKASVMLKKGSGKVGDSSPGESVNSAEDLRKFERGLLASMVSTVGEAQPFFSAGDAMWCLLICDMNVACACSVDCDPCTRPSVSIEVPASQGVGHQTMLGSSSNVTAPSLAGPESSVTLQEKLTTVLPVSRIAGKANLSAVLGIPNLPNSKSSASPDMPAIITNLQPRGPVTLADHLEEQPFVAAATQSLKDDKPTASKKVTIGGSKRDSSHRQKSMNFEKGFRAWGSKGSLRSCKQSSLGNAVLDRKCKSISDSTGIGMKSSSKVGKVIAASVTRSEVSLDLSFNAGVPSTPFDAKLAGAPTPAPAANTDLSLSVPSTSNNSAPSANQDIRADIPNESNNNVFSYDKLCKDWVPQDKKDEMVLKLLPRVRELQAQMQDWTDWAQQKVMQAARRLGKDREELQSLRQEKEELGRLQEERQNLEESTRKKLAEMESAISKASGQVERENAATRRLEVENAHLRLEMEDAKVQAVESAANCQELSRKEEKTLKRFQSWESQRALLQEELATGKSKLSHVQRQLEQAKEQQEQLQTRWKQEEASKNEAIARVSAERREREKIETSARSQENSLLLKAENDMQRYKSDIRALELQISQLKILTDTSKVAAPKWSTDKSYASRLSEGRKNKSTQILAKVMVTPDLDFDDIQRERECVMCLSEEMSVVFLPCGHQVVCTKCNGLHEKQGMKDCPSCRTPIQRRVCAHYA